MTPLPNIAVAVGSGTEIRLGMIRVWEPFGFVAVRLTVSDLAMLPSSMAAESSAEPPRPMFVQ